MESNEEEKENVGELSDLRKIQHEKWLKEQEEDSKTEGDSSEVSKESDLKKQLKEQEEITRNAEEEMRKLEEMQRKLMEQMREASKRQKTALLRLKELQLTQQGENPKKDEETEVEMENERDVQVRQDHELSLRIQEEIQRDIMENVKDQELKDRQYARLIQEEDEGHGWAIRRPSLIRRRQSPRSPNKSSGIKKVKEILKNELMEMEPSKSTHMESPPSPEHHPIRVERLIRAPPINRSVMEDENLQGNIPQAGIYTRPDGTSVEVRVRHNPDGSDSIITTRRHPSGDIDVSTQSVGGPRDLRNFTTSGQTPISREIEQMQREREESGTNVYPLGIPTEVLEDNSVEFTVNSDRDIPPDQKMCVLCLSDFKQGDVCKRLTCWHMFHSKGKNCVEGGIERWSRMKGECPICRRKIMDKRMKKHPDEKEKKV